MSRYRDEDTESKVYVGDLPRDAEERELERAFGHYGPLKSVWVARNPSGFAFIQFEDSRDAEDAVRALDGSTMCGVRIRVEHATGKKRPKPWNRGGGSGGRGSSSRYDSGPRRPAFDPNDRCFTCNERGHYSYDCPRTGGSRYSGRKRSPSRSRSRDRDRKRSYSRSPSRSPSPRGARGGGRSPRGRSGSRSD